MSSFQRSTNKFYLLLARCKIKSTGAVFTEEEKTKWMSCVAVGVYLCDLVKTNAQRLAQRGPNVTDC